MIASAAAQLNDADVRKVHQAVVAHCTKMADVARNRIGIGSVTASETNNINSILDHANDVRSDTSILRIRLALKALLPGLLGLQDSSSRRHSKRSQRLVFLRDATPTHS